MIKSILEANENIKSNDREIEILHKHFPQCFNSEGKFDIDKFQGIIKEDVDITFEGESLNFLGKGYARLLASTETNTIVQPDIAHNSKPENINSENIYISGDNLDGLKHLLNSYAGKVKCIYIDPPYNTGTDGFIYNDNFNFSVEELSVKLSVSEERAAKILDLTKRGSASHAAWLTFMLPRLQLAKDLLTDDGVIFISIDDNEQANLRLLCNDIFGEENFEGNIHYRRRSNQPNDKTKLIGLVAEHVLVYSKNAQYLKSVGVGKIALSGNFSNPDSDPRGDWASKPWKTGSDQSGTRYIITAPNGNLLDEEWMGDENTYKSLCEDNRIIFPKNGDGMPRKKYFKFERELEGQCATNWWTPEVYGDNASANAELENLFGFKNAFSNPKHTTLINAIIGLANIKNGDIVVDFFGGSASTAHSALQFSSTSDNVKFILIQLPESLDYKYEVATSSDKEKIKQSIDFLEENNHPHTLDYIGFERIKRAARKIKEETGADIDYGFKHYTLVEPSDDTIDKMVDFDSTTNLVFSDDEILKRYGKESVLETWLVRDGYGFGAKFNKITLNKYNAYHCNKHLYMLDPNLTEMDVVALIDLYSSDPSFNPENIVIFGYSFTFNQKETMSRNIASLGKKINIDVRY